MCGSPLGSVIYSKGQCDQQETGMRNWSCMSVCVEVYVFVWYRSQVRSSQDSLSFFSSQTKCTKTEPDIFSMEPKQDCNERNVNGCPFPS